MDSVQRSDRSTGRVRIETSEWIFGDCRMDGGNVSAVTVEKEEPVESVTGKGDHTIPNDAHERRGTQAH